MFKLFRKRDNNLNSELGSAIDTLKASEEIKEVVNRRHEELLAWNSLTYEERKEYFDNHLPFKHTLKITFSTGEVFLELNHQTERIDVKVREWIRENSVVQINGTYYNFASVISFKVIQTVTNPHGMKRREYVRFVKQNRKEEM